MKLLPSILALALLLFGSSVGAAVRYTSDVGVSSIELEQEITSADLRALRDNPNIKSGKGVFVFLNSPGGDLQTAVEIGRLLRATRSQAMVRSRESCMSACVMVLVGAVDRFFGSEAVVGIHRPYSPTNIALSQAEATKRYRELESATRKYLQEMNVTDALFDAMVTVPAEDIRILTLGELSTLGLRGIDPVEAEMRDAADASKYGLSRVEYLARKRSSEQQCRPPKDEDFISGRGSDLLREYESCTERVLRTGR